MSEEEKVFATLRRGKPPYPVSELRVSLASYRGRQFVDLRMWEPQGNSSGLIRTSKGVSVRMGELEQVACALLDIAKAFSSSNTNRPPAQQPKPPPPKPEPFAIDENDDLPF
jgi:hypothetical protein